MAKNFPYFKFLATEWLTGDIVFEDYELQGIFINICALYWHREANVSIEEIKKRLKTNRVDELIGRFICKNENNTISIKFLDEQLIEANHISKVNSENGKKGVIAKRNKANAKRTLSEPLAKLSKEEEEEEEEINKNNNKNNNIEQRKINFAHTLTPFIEIYGKELIRDFFNYWTEHNKSNTKFKQELENTWNAERRLKTWSERDKNFKGVKKVETPEEALKRKQEEASRF